MRGAAPLALKLFGCGLLAVSVASVAGAAECGVSIGGPAVLSSDSLDPDVLVWDSRDRLVDYVSGHWQPTREIFKHTMLAPHGTHAVVVSCYPGVAHPPNSPDAADAIGIRVQNGPYRGRYGWVISTDVHRAALERTVGHN